MSADPLARILTERQLLAADAIVQWTQRAAAAQLPLEQVLLQGGVFDRSTLLQVLENQYFCASVDVSEAPYEPGLLALLPRRLATLHMALPVRRDHDIVQVAFAEPDNAKAVDAVSFAMRRQVRTLVALRHELKSQIEHRYRRFEEEAAGPARKPAPGPPAARARIAADTGQLQMTDPQPVAIVDKLLEEAVRRGASDIHVQPGERELRVRFRLDGILQTVMTLPVELSASVASRLKVIALMDVAERRRPQDGRATFRHGDKEYDLRVSSLPSQFGEKVVLRLLSKNATLLDLEKLKMPGAVRRAFQDVIDVPQGLFLVTGPTGSGKTTTLYATLNAVDREAVNVVTLEDPIEYSVPMVTQVQINEDAGLTFAAGLRSILRQDPDVVLVGEIRDTETVEIACRAALTGHKVLSTIHTNETSQAVTRLVNMGTAVYLLAATLRGVLAQRLVRQVCSACKETYQPNDTERAVLGHRRIESLWRGAGCPECAGTGYKGRFAIYEYLRVDDPIQRLILDRASAYTIRHAAERAGMCTLGDAARIAAIEGITTVAEIQRAVLAEENRDQLCSNCQHVVSADYTICPYCQHVLKERCAKCGNPVEGSWQACPSCGNEIDRAWQRLHCRHCQAPVDAAWSSCLYCGGELR